MKRILVIAATLLVASGCEGSRSIPYLMEVQPNPFLPFDIELLWEPFAGHVDAYAVEARTPGGTFTVLPERFALPGAATRAEVDLTSFLPNGGPVELRIRAEPGGILSNSRIYDPGPPLSANAVTDTPDPKSHAFVVTYGNPTAATVALERRVVQADQTAGPFVQVASSKGANNTFLDADLSAWVDGARYEYRTIASLAGASPSAIVHTSNAALIAPAIVSYGPAASGGADLVLRNDSAHATFVQVAGGPRGNTRLIGSFPLPPFGQTITVNDAGGRSGINFYQLEPASNSINRNFARFWEILQSADAPLQPKAVSLQRGDSAARDAAGNFCIVAAGFSSGAQVSATVVAPGGAGTPLNLSVNVSPKCLIDAAGRSHVVYFESTAANGPGSINHSWYDGTAWQSELIATRTNPTTNDGHDSIAFDVGLDGTLFAAWFAGGLLEIAVEKAGTSWTVETIPTPGPPGLLAVTGDENGAPHLVSLQFASFHFFLDGSGAWTSEVISDFHGGAGGPVISLSAVGGEVSFVTNLENNLHDGHSFLRRGATGWTAFPLILGNNFSSASRSADGHAFILPAFFAGSVEIVRDGVSEVDAIAAADSVDGVSVQTSAGFDPQGRIWVLEWLTPDSAADLPVLNDVFLFEAR
jgi:hypothetical protein